MGEAYTFLVYLKSEVKSEQKNNAKVVSAVVREFQAETVAMKLENNNKILKTAVNQQTLKISHVSALVDKNAATRATVKRASRETVERKDKTTKDVRVAMKNANSNKKLPEDRKKNTYDMARHV